MVDFSNDSMISKPPTDVINLIVIEHWYNWRLAWEFYVKNSMNRTKVGVAECRSRLSNLFLATERLMFRKLTAKDKITYDELKELCCNVNYKVDEMQMLEAYLLINQKLDEAGLIKVDTKPQVDRTKVELSNKAYGY